MEGTQVQAVQRDMSDIIVAATVEGTQVQAIQRDMSDIVAGIVEGTQVQAIQRDMSDIIMAATVEGTQVQTIQRDMSDIVAATVEGTQVQAIQRDMSDIVAATVEDTQIQNSQPVGNPLCGVQPCQPLLPDRHHPGTVAQDSAPMAATPSVETLLWLPAGQTQSPCEHDAGPLCVAQLAIYGRVNVHYKKY